MYILIWLAKYLFSTKLLNFYVDIFSSRQCFFLFLFTRNRCNFRWRASMDIRNHLCYRKRPCTISFLFYYFTKNKQWLISSRTSVRGGKYEKFAVGMGKKAKRGETDESLSVPFERRRHSVFRKSGKPSRVAYCGTGKN